MELALNIPDFKGWSVRVHPRTAVLGEPGAILTGQVARAPGD